MPLPAGTYYPASISLYDQSRETGVLEVFGAPIVEGTYDDGVTAFLAFLSAVNAMTIGTVIKTEYGGYRTLAVVALPGTNLAQRENKLFVKYQDNVTGEKYTSTIPTVDLTKVVFLPEAKDFVSLTAPAEMVTLVTQWQTFVKAARTGNAVTVTGAKFVGRNT